MIHAGKITCDKCGAFLGMWKPGQPPPRLETKTTLSMEADPPCCHKSLAAAIGKVSRPLSSGETMAAQMRREMGVV